MTMVHSADQKIYSIDWFKQKALDSLRQIEPRRWDFKESLLLYAPGAEERYEKIQEEETPYQKLVTVPEREYLRSIAGPLANHLPADFDYLDLGPGSEHKEQFLFDALTAQGKKFIYRPVDVSQRFLSIATDHATAQGLHTDPVQCTFEQLPMSLAYARPHFASLGLTYSNYDPHEILPLLKRIAGDGGCVFIDSQIRERAPLTALVDAYRQDARGIIDAKMQLLGLDPVADVRDETVTDEIRVWCTLARVTPALEARGLQAGDSLLVFQSLRPALESFKTDISKVFPSHELFDTESEFVGALLKV